MRLEPFLSVDGVPFAATREDVVRLHGSPLSQERNDVRLTALDYGEVVYRFQDAEDGGRLEEITRQAPVLDLGEVQVPFAQLAAFIREHDPQAFERAGFLVSPRFGLAFVPGEPSWVTALAAHCLPQWRALSGMGLH